MQPSVIVGRLGLIVVAVILITKQRSVRSHRDRLDIYYDEQQRALEDARIHTHRRATDPPTEGER
jgi:Na+-transporting NADH:ubiquinone oxidoreductase subunit NqrF